MRLAIFAIAACIMPAGPASADWTWGGHGKVQFSFQLFEPEDVGAVLVAEHVYLTTGDFRVNAGYRRGSLDVTGQGQIFVLGGNLLHARSDARLEYVGGALRGFPDPSDSRRLLDLSVTISEGDDHLVFARMDRLSVGLTRGPLVLRLGRQALSWGNGLVFQVLDLFNPFPPDAVDTEYKPGDDMLTAQWLFANGDDLQGIVVPRRGGRDAPLEAGQSSAAVKWQHLAGSTQLEILGARHYHDTIAGFGLTGDVVGGVWRVDVAQTFGQNGDRGTSLVANLDRGWVWGGKNFYGYAEYFRNGFGATSFDQGLEALDPRLVERVARGELFSLGCDELAAGLRLEWTPLTTLEPTVLVNLNDPSSYLLFRLHHDWKENLIVEGGIQLGFGGRDTEYGGIYSRELGAFLAPGGMFWIRLSRYF